MVAELRRPCPFGLPAGADGGSAAAELVIVTPLLLCFLGALVLGAQLLSARQQVGDAARTAVEVAVLARSPAAARAAAAATARADLAGDRAPCSRVTVRTATRSFRPGGSVSVAVSCTVALPRLPYLPVRLPLEVRAHEKATVEPFRAMQP